ncbi:hydroxymethylglutaryl-CoA lyase [Azospirillum sp. TSH7]|jgi:hydroxymethylglutaryl-CoA lyase|uniref:hydroxymethylglutaryl-CoA lyase n=1 Tax=unclassified Azospirillum TaxID=2630922 RepID=UPI000D604F55|nr:MULTISPECIES: hydroxymethylglutaryl-CoA lyase [unclassified Azospirillum]PWC63039.1 hydroxymethylglutaryl-CoA lyase [Azospirillum sp. TSH7]PWC72682.1 hydroxymethylglutaryl-CoA lyase [Azospirillum sp. TSH20]
MDRLLLTEVAPRDGLQNQPILVPTAGKLELIRRLAEAGLTRIEAASFASPKAVPQMADAEEIVAGIRSLPGVDVSALAMNGRGLDRALACGTPQIATVVAATEEMNRRNINMTLDRATAAAEEVIGRALEAGIAVRAYVAVAFECPFEGPVEPAAVIRLAERFAAIGADEVVIADTIGAAAPGQVTALLRALLPSLPAERIGMHFHDTRGFGIANAHAAIEAGIRRLDASAGGIGGCPFAPGAAGNLATEDVVLLAEKSGLATGVDLPALIDAVDVAGRLLGRPLGGRAMPWLRRSHAQPTGVPG